MSTRRSFRRNKGSPQKDNQEEVANADKEKGLQEQQQADKDKNGQDQQQDELQEQQKVEKGGNGQKQDMLQEEEQVHLQEEQEQKEELIEEAEAKEVLEEEETKGKDEGEGAEEADVVGDNVQEDANGGENEEDEEVAKIMGSDNDREEENDVKGASASSSDIEEVTPPNLPPAEESSSSPEVVSVSSESEGDKKASSSGSKGGGEEPEVVELTDDDEQESLEEDENEQEEDEYEEEEKEDPKGDPEKEPGTDADKDRFLPEAHLVPFRLGWKREVVITKSKKLFTEVVDVHYVPPEGTKFRTREAKRKRVSKRDQERYFDDFPSRDMSIANFSYVRRPLGLNNAAYEVVRKRRRDDPPSTHQAMQKKELPKSSKGGKVKGKGGKKQVSYKEVEEFVGLMEDTDDSDDGEESANFMRGLDVDLPLCLQIATDAPGMRVEHKRRRRRRDPETCCTPPLAEDELWPQVDEDPVGVFSELGGGSSPPTPPPLRALRLTREANVERIASALDRVKKEAAKVKVTEEQETKENLASHDAAIRRFKNYVEKKSFRDSSFGSPRSQAAGLVRHLPGISLSNATNQQRAWMNGGSNQFQRRHPNPLLQNRPRPGFGGGGFGSGGQPSIMGKSNMVKVKLPMKAINGKRPIVELVMEQGGRYQPIKFSNNMQVTEAIPKALFDKANAQRKTVYQRASQVPRIGDKVLYLAVNPSPTAVSLMQRTAHRPAQGMQPGGSRYAGLPKFRIGGGKPIQHRPFRQQQQQQQMQHQQQMNRQRHLQQQQQMQRQRHQQQEQLRIGNARPRPGMGAAPQRPQPSSSSSSAPPPSGDQVAILVKPQSGANAKHVLLNVPRRVALKVKPGTTLSFSASNDQKYIVVDSKIHPPVGSGGGKSGVAPAPNPAATGSGSANGSIRNNNGAFNRQPISSGASPSLASPGGGGVRPFGKGVSIGPASSMAKLPLPPGLASLPLPPGLTAGAAARPSSSSSSRPPPPRNPLLAGRQFSALPSSSSPNRGPPNPLLHRQRPMVGGGGGPVVSRGPPVRRPAAGPGGGTRQPPPKSRKVLSTGEV